MTTRFERALAFTRPFEGGLVLDPDDPGLATNYGISLRFLVATGEIEAFDYDRDGDVDAEDVKIMTPANSATIFKRYFWRDWMDRGDVPEAFAIKAFDFGVNMGPGQAARLVQRALNEVWAVPLRVDGIIGPRSLDALEELDAGDVREAQGDLEDHAARFYYAIAEKRIPSRKYLFGWLRRAYTRPEA